MPIFRKKPTPLESIKVEKSSLEFETTPTAGVSPSDEDAPIADKIQKIREAISKILDSVAKESSLFTRLSNWFGTKPWWLKLLIGILLLVPTLITGLVTHMIIFFVFCGLTALIYLTISALMVDHYKSVKKYLTPLKDGIFSIADILGIVIEKLDSLGKLIAAQVSKLEKENITLSTSVSNLTQQVGDLNISANSIKASEQKLAAEVTKLAHHEQALQKDIAEHELLVKQLEQVIFKNKIDTEAITTKLERQVTELKANNETLSNDLTKTKIISQNLKTSVDMLSGSVIEDEEQRKKFQATLDSFLSNADIHFAKVTKELETVNGKLAETTKRYESLLERQEKQVSRLEKINVQSAKGDAKPSYGKFFKEYEESANNAFSLSQLANTEILVNIT